MVGREPLWSEDQARAAVRQGFTFPFKDRPLAVRQAHLRESKSLVYNHCLLALMHPTEMRLVFRPYTNVWANTLAFDTPEAAIVWADIEGWGSGTDS